MIAYLDSSVLLRRILGQPGSLEEWPRIDPGISSALAEVECLRTLDRMRLKGDYTDDVVAERRRAIYDVLNSIAVVEITSAVLARAAQPFPTAIRTLDAIHLATALLWKEQAGQDLTMATHDRALAVSAKAMGLQVVGV